VELVTLLVLIQQELPHFVPKFAEKDVSAYQALFAKAEDALQLQIVEKINEMK
jgi:hypothetical protein